ncbi:MAG TPA: tyrosine-type recombinase/integrase [Solirubrobacteraceae bacterium]|nr:tyrosine-type recombinase/integrase [Solirubrobacteraceae bacterium]
MAATKTKKGRRDYGTGTLLVIGSSWYGMWREADGRRVKRKLGAARTAGKADGLTKPQAEERLRKLRAESGLVVVREARRVTLELAGAEYCRRLAVNNAKKSYRLTQAADLRNHLVPHFGDKTLDRIQVRDVERYIAAKQSTLALKTIRNHVNTLHSIFELGIKQGWCTANPVKLADRPRIRRTETRIRFLELEELERLVSTPYPDDAWGRVEPALYLTAAMTGLRQGELLGLRWRDVDFKSRRVRVVTNYVRGEFDHPKSAESARSVPMGRKVEEALSELRARSHYSHDRDLVFAHPESGKPLDRSKLSRRYNQAIKRAEVPRVTFHELRHTFGTTMAKAGVPRRTIQAWMGHEDGSTTDVYMHYAPSPDEVAAVDRAFS